MTNLYHLLQRSLFAFFLLLSIGTAWGQDTVVVQTLTWDDNFRSGFFQFPDDPDETYRKILMVYNMRCHDAAVGFGNVGCREWDYSCNTFITDPSLVDSTAATHPSHIISNFDGDIFAYTSEQTYTYYQFDQYEVTYNNTISEIEAPVGSISSYQDLSQDTRVARHQFMYTAAELSAAGLTAGPITGLQIELEEAGVTLPFLRIKMQATEEDQLNADMPFLTGFTEVYALNTEFTTAGPQFFPFYQNFDWDGTSNVVVEWSYTSNDPILTSQTTAIDEPGFACGLLNSTSDANIEFAGSGYVDLPAQALADGISEQITVAFWAYGNEDVLPVNTYAFEGFDANGQRQINAHLPWSNGQMYWDCGNDGTGYDRINKTATAAEIGGRWNHWAMTKNAATGSMKIYLNGELWHSGTGKNKLIDLNSVVVGTSGSLAGQYYGNLDEFQIWNIELDQSTLQEWMRTPITSDHPNYNNLLAYYPFDEGTGTTVQDHSSVGATASVVGFPSWRVLRGANLHKNFTAVDQRPQTTFFSGEYDITTEVVTATDQVPNSLHSITSYGVDGTDLVTLNEEFFYAAIDQEIIDEAGNVVGTVPVASEGSIEISTLDYYNKTDGKLEILSLVTPYGNGLDLGNAGKTFTIDVTDYAPILKGEKWMSIEMGGQNQEELDIQFWYIKGTPEREVQSVQNIWPFRRGWYGDIVDNRFFEPRDVPLSSDGSHFKVRTAVTGHGQNGEFIPRQHYININGGAQDFQFDVWKSCGENPMYPQGGTWLFDRAGWCPGLPTDIHSLELDGIANAGETVEIDYGVNGATLTEANYLVSSQLVTYGPWAHNVDASLEAVIRPTLQWEYQRMNPACNAPMVLVRNSGAETITSIEIEYQVENGPFTSDYTWEGSLESGQEMVIELPQENIGFYMTGDDSKVFTARIVAVNGAEDGNPENNEFHSAFEYPEMFSAENLLTLRVSTNNRASENSYTVKNSSGQVLLTRDNMANSTTYFDEMDFPAGCYTMEFEDTAGDGLAYWYWDLVDPSVGSGTIRIQQNFNGIDLTVESFEPEFGGTLFYDFVIGEVTSTEEVETFRFFSLYPNPVSSELILDLQGYEGNGFQWEIVDPMGRIYQQSELPVLSGGSYQHSIQVNDLAPGMYFARIRNAEKTWVRSFVKQ